MRNAVGISHRDAALQCGCLMIALITSVLPFGRIARADDQAEPTKPAAPPKVAMCVPLGVPAGKTSKVILRGWEFDGAQEVRTSEPSCTVKVVSSSSANVPGGQDAKRIGDVQLELEVSVPADVTFGLFHLTVVSTSGESAPQPVLVDEGIPVANESEPNDGFDQAQALSVPQMVEGQIHVDRNVDVFRFELESPRSISIDVIARRNGSALDSLLTLFDRQGSIIAVDDDQPASTDSAITTELPAGVFFLSLQDAQDRGGAAHPYRLRLRETKSE